jgi:hypothetical protein
MSVNIFFHKWFPLFHRQLSVMRVDSLANLQWLIQSKYMDSVY